jgi:2-keto-4-pentenoate hydratase/2-oxohepta-3-ene-1,7-dioic acid hydratase in catechol pathway
MRLLAFSEKGRRSIGAELDTDHIVDFHRAHGAMPTGMRAFLEQGHEALEEARGIINAPPREAVLLKREVQVSSPLSSKERPKIFCIGVNYADHAAETGSKIPEEPIVFAKFPTSLISPLDNIVIPPNSTMLDYEAELVVVIGRRAHRVRQAEAYDYVVGYTCGNDVSERQFQRSDRQWLRAKSSDTFAPTGPAIVTKNEIPDPHELRLGSKVNGELRQNSSASLMIFKVPKLVEFISHYLTLEPGDMIFTGTPPGVGLGYKPPRFLSAGDEVEIWIERIGSIVNTVVKID